MNRLNICSKIADELYDKLERKLEMTSKLTPESFDALVAEFKYYDVEGQEDIEKLELVDNMTEQEVSVA